MSLVQITPFFSSIETLFQLNVLPPTYMSFRFEISSNLPQMERVIRQQKQIRSGFSSGHKVKRSILLLIIYLSLQRPCAVCIFGVQIFFNATKKNCKHLPGNLKIDCLQAEMCERQKAASCKQFFLKFFLNRFVFCRKCKNSQR